VVSHPTLATLATGLASGTCSSRSLAEECLTRIEDPSGEGRRAFVHVERDAVLAQASAMDAVRASGAAPCAYAGIPISIKDLFDVAGQVTRCGSVVLADRPAARDNAACVARLRRAGFVVIGRTNMTEFAYSGLGVNPHYGTPLNPWHRAGRHIPGGSSSGAAVSVADGMVHAAIGTDTGGSCRIPAAFTGLVGFKPTARRIPQDGTIPLSTSLDSIGPIARSVACCELLDAIMAGETPPEQHAVQPGRLRLAIPRTTVLADMDSHVTASFERSIARIATQARIEHIDIPEFAQLAAINCKGTLPAAESFAWHRSLLASRASQYDPRVLSRIQAGGSMSAADYIALKQARRLFIASVEARLRDFDALLMPTVPVLPPRLADLEQDADYYRINALVLRNSSIINFLDGCAISLPIHTPGEPPVGLTLACLRNQDRHLFRCAAGIESLLSRTE
jgi:aspartyl-tRNA(Asn)/glutamyl-tRNA(Gln) amidotransferase subunit A